MRAPLLTICLIVPFFIFSTNALSCWPDGKYCSEVLSASLLRFNSLEYKCQFPIFLAKNSIIRLEPTLYYTTKIGEYCPESCCSVTQNAIPSTTVTATRSTTPSTTTPATTTTTSNRTQLEKFNDAMNSDGAFKSLMDAIDFNSTAADGLKRFQVYSQAKKEVDEHNIQYNLGLSSFKMATNKFSVALDGEIAPLTLSLEGLTPTVTLPPDSSSLKRKRRNAEASVDWTPYMKPILNQLTCGGCWAFSMIAMIESFFAIHGYNTSSLSVQQLLTCDTARDPTYSVANIGCRGGYLQVAGTYLKSTAARDASYIPFDMQDTSCDSSFFPPAAPTILTFDEGYISGNLTASQLIAMEQSIEDKVRKGPVAVGMAASADIYKYSEGVYDGNCGASINHAVVIVGFTDDYWIIRNSWGATWGENGYFRVKRIPGKDPCKLYSYWSQATAIGANETFAPPASAEENNRLSTSNATSDEKSQNKTNKCGENMCENDCGYGYDDEEDDSEDDYEEENVKEETTLTTPLPSNALFRTSSPTSFTGTATNSFKTAKALIPAVKTSTTTRRATSTTPRRTTTRQKSIFDKWVDEWNYLIG